MKEFLTRRSVLLTLSLTFVAVEICIGIFVYHEWRKATIAQNKIDDQFKFLSVENWKKYSSMDGKFSVLFPGDPEETNLTITVSTNSLEEHISYINANVQNAFAVAYADNAKNASWDKGTNGEYYLQQIQSGTISQKPGSLLFQQAFTFEGYPAREFEFAVGGKANYSVRYKMILVHQRLYIIYVIFRTANPYPRFRAIFFNSFALND